MTNACLQQLNTVLGELFNSCLQSVRMITCVTCWVLRHGKELSEIKVNEKGLNRVSWLYFTIAMGLSALIFPNIHTCISFKYKHSTMIDKH